MVGVGVDAGLALPSWLGLPLRLLLLLALSLELFSNAICTSTLRVAAGSCDRTFGAGQNLKQKFCDHNLTVAEVLSSSICTLLHTASQSWYFTSL